MSTGNNNNGIQPQSNNNTGLDSQSPIIIIDDDNNDNTNQNNNNHHFSVSPYQQQQQLANLLQQQQMHLLSNNLMQFFPQFNQQPQFISFAPNVQQQQHMNVNPPPPTNAHRVYNANLTVASVIPPIQRDPATKASILREKLLKGSTPSPHRYPPSHQRVISTIISGNNPMSPASSVTTNSSLATPNSQSVKLQVSQKVKNSELRMASPVKVSDYVSVSNFPVSSVNSPGISGGGEESGPGSLIGTGAENAQHSISPRSSKSKKLTSKENIQLELQKLLHSSSPISKDQEDPIEKQTKDQSEGIVGTESDEGKKVAQELSDSDLKESSDLVPEKNAGQEALEQKLERETDPEDLFFVGEEVLAYHSHWLYKAKIKNRKINEPRSEFQYLLHYQGWNSKWDEWVGSDRILKYTSENIEYMKELKKNNPHTNGFNGSNGSKRKNSALNASSYSFQASSKRRKSSSKDEFAEVDQESSPYSPSEETERVVLNRGIRVSRSDSEFILKTIDKVLTKDELLRGSSEMKPIPAKQQASHAFKLSEVLQQFLVDDLERLCGSGKLIKIPKQRTVSMILNDYASSNAKEEVSKFAKCLGLYFDRALSPHLLYRFERLQHQKYSEENPEKAPSGIYGVEHLLRLCAKFPALLQQAKAPQEQRQKITSLLSDLVVYLERNLEAFRVGTEEIEMSNEDIAKSEEIYPLAENTIM